MKILGPLDSKKHKEFIAPIMAGVKFFTPLSPEQLEKLLNFVKFVEFEKGETIVEKDAPGEAFFVLYTGKVEARAPSSSGGKVINTMGPKDFFGELALILKEPRTATIVCVEPARCFMPDQRSFALLLKKNPDIAVLVLTVASKRFYKYH